MKRMPLNSRYFRIILRFGLLFAFIVFGGRGIFSEESSISTPLLRTSASYTNTYFTKIVFKGFNILVPTSFLKESYAFPSKHTQARLPLQERKIMGNGRSSVRMLAEFLENNNHKIPKAKALKIAHIYVQEADKEGVNYDVAFSQMCLETGFLKYGGDVKPQQNNFCGLGVVSKGLHGLSFPSIRIGIRAHIQHLKAYATTARIKNPIVDRRLKFVKRGSIKTIKDFSGKWATDRHYSRKLYSLMTRLYREKSN